jgi:hypothetical protein
MSKIELPAVTGSNNTSRINDNFQKIEDALNQEVLYRKGYVGEPNEMETNLDMNGKRVLNLPDATSPTEPVTLGQLEGIDSGDALALRNDLAAPTGSSIIGFQQVGTGSVVRTSQDKLQESVTILDKGAIGDGLTDCAAAMISAGNSTTGVITVPGGNFTVTATTSNSAQILALLSRLKIYGSLSINLTAGTHNFTSPVRVFSGGMDVNSLRITGAAPVSTSITGQVSVSGTAGAYSAVLQLSTVTGVAVGDFIHTWTVVGTGIPEVHRGMWEITNVDTVNTQITVINTCRKATFPANTITSSNSVVLKTIMKFESCDGFVVTGSRIDFLNSVAIVGNADTYWSSSNVTGTEKGTHGLTIGSMTIAVNGKADNANQYGVSKGHVSCGPYVGISNFDQQGVVTELGGTFWGDFVSACNNCRRGFYASTGSSIRAKHISTNGNFLDGAICDIGAAMYSSSTSCSIGNGGRGVTASQTSTLVFDSGIMSANVLDGAGAALGGCVQATGARFEFNGGSGAYGDYGGTLVVNNSTMANNTRYGVDIATGASARALACAFLTNTLHGVRATELATCVVTGSTFTGNVAGDKNTRGDGLILDGAVYTASTKYGSEYRIISGIAGQGARIASTSGGDDFVIGHDSTGAGTFTAKWHFRNGVTGFYPETDNDTPIGRASNRPSVLFAGTATINTSDENLKSSIKEVDDKVLDAWEQCGYAQYKFNDAVARKGDGARWHFGVIAQRVRNSFEAQGLDPFEYGILCYDEWGEEAETIDDDGNIVGRHIEAGSRFGIRYEEALCLESALLRREKLKVASKFAELEDRIARLED